MKTIILLLMTVFAGSAMAQTYDTNGAFVQTFVGSAFNGYYDGLGQMTMFSGPSKVVSDSSGNLFVLDIGNYRVRKVATDGTVSTFVGGGGHQPPSSGTNAALSLSSSSFMAIDNANNLIVGTPFASLSSFVKITPDSSCSLLPITNTIYSSGVCFDSYGNMYYGNSSKIYVLHTNGLSEVFVGSGNSGTIDGNGIFTSFNSPIPLACDGGNNIYVYDTPKIRRVNQARDVNTVAGVSITSLTSMAFDASGNLIFAAGGEWVGRIDPKTNIAILAGSTSQTGYTNGIGSLARFNGASGVCVSGGVIYVADASNQRIRSITNNPAPQIVSAGALSVGNYAGVTITGVVGRTYKIESSSDLANWSQTAQLVLNSSPYLWIDPTTQGVKKFYRAVMQP